MSLARRPAPAPEEGDELDGAGRPRASARSASAGRAVPEGDGAPVDGGPLAGALGSAPGSGSGRLCDPRAVGCWRASSSRRGTRVAGGGDPPATGGAGGVWDPSPGTGTPRGAAGRPV